MGTRVAALDRLASDLAATAHLLNRAAVIAAAAEDLVTGIMVDAASWAAAELAATVVADTLTLGLATAGGAVVESATLAAFVARAERVSADCAAALERLAAELADLKTAHDAIAAAHGLDAVRALRGAQNTITGLRVTGTAFRVAERATDAVVGRETGLPLDVRGPKSLGSAAVHTTIDATRNAVSGR